MAENSNNNSISYSDLVKPDNSIEQLVTQLEELRKTYTKALRDIKQEAIQLSAQLRTVSGATQQGQRVVRTASVETDRLSRAQRNLSDSQGVTATRIAELRRAQTEANQINRLTARLNQAAEGSYNRLSAQYSLNRIRLNSLSRTERDATEEGRALTEQTRLLRVEMHRLQSATGNTSLNVGNYPQQIGNLVGLNNEFGQSLIGLSQAEGGISGFFRNLGTNVVAFGRTLLGLLTNPVFLAIAGIAAAGTAFKFWYDYNVGLIEATKLTKQFTNLSGNDLKALRAEIQATADLYDSDYKEVLISSNALAKQFGISQQEAIKLVQEGFIAGGNANGEFLETIKEYPAYFKEAGLSASQFIAITAQAAKSGIYSDKAVDTIKEGNIRIREMTKSTADALTGIGINYKTLQTDLQSGAITTFDALQMVSTKLGELPESSAVVGTAIADIFGGPGEDAGLAYIKTLKDIDTDLSNVTAASGELGQVQRELLESNVELSNVTAALFDTTGGFFETIITKGKIFANNVLIAIVKGLINVANWGIQVYNGILAIRVGVQGIITAFKLLWETVKLVFNFIFIIAKAAGDALAALFTLDLESFNASMVKFIRSQEKAAKDYANSTVKILKKGVIDINKKLDPIVIPVLNGGDATAPTAPKGGKAPIVNYTKKEKPKKETDPNVVYKKNLELQRKYEDAVLSLEKDSFEKRRKEILYNYQRQSQDLQFQLKTEKDLTEVGKKAIRSSILLLGQQQTQDMEKLENDRNISLLEQQKTGIQLRLDAVKKGTEEEYNLRVELLEKERQLELAQNKAKPVSEQKTEESINSKYSFNKSAIDDEFLQLALVRYDHLQAMEQSEFDLLYNSEARKTKFRLEQEKKRLQKILALNSLMGNKLSDVEVTTIKKTISKIDKEISEGTKGKKDIYEMVGLNMDDDAKAAIDQSTSFALDQIRSILDSKVQAAEIAVTAADKEVDSAQKILDSEMEARANGYANNVVMAQKELDAAKKNQEKANKEKEKAVKQQQMLDTITQASSLITASANIWSSLSAIPIVGTALAIAAIGLMWGSFAASKIKARSVTKAAGSESYGDGTVELLGGGSHQSGNDVDLGEKADGTKRRAEGGEFFAVINKRNSRKYRRVIPDVIKSFNNGSFAQKYLGAYDGAKNISVNVDQGGNDFSQIKEDVSEIRSRKRYITDGNGNTVEIYKNLKRTIKR
jgi:hypothetical protein